MKNKKTFTDLRAVATYWNELTAKGIPSSNIHTNPSFNVTKNQFEYLVFTM